MQTYHCQIPMLTRLAMMHITRHALPPYESGCMMFSTNWYTKISLHKISKGVFLMFCHSLSLQRNFLMYIVNEVPFVWLGKSRFWKPALVEARSSGLMSKDVYLCQISTLRQGLKHLEGFEGFCNMSIKHSKQSYRVLQ